MPAFCEISSTLKFTHALPRAHALLCCCVAGDDDKKQQPHENFLKKRNKRKLYIYISTLPVVGVTARYIRVRAHVTTVEGARGREGEAQSRPCAVRGFCAPRMRRRAVSVRHVCAPRLCRRAASARRARAPRPRATKPRPSKLLVRFRAALAETVLGAARAVPPEPSRSVLLRIGSAWQRPHHSLLFSWARPREAHAICAAERGSAAAAAIAPGCCARAFADCASERGSAADAAVAPSCCARVFAVCAAERGSAADAAVPSG